LPDCARGIDESVSAVVSTDGDGDRPLFLPVEAGKVRFMPGDLLGLLAARFLGVRHVAVPVNCSDAVDEFWRAEGIATDHVEVAEGETSGVAQILVYDDGDNSIAVFPGASAGLGARHAQAARKTIAASRVVMASSEVPLEVTMEAFRIARDAGATTLLNPAPARPLPDELLRLTDVMTPNEGEAPVLASAAADSPVDAAANALLSRGAKAVLVTLGAAGCMLYAAGAAPRGLVGRRMAVVDTIGAGDTFTGALAAAMARGEGLPDAMRWANAAAALSVTGRGAIGGMPSKSQVRALLAEGA
jgi:ribokinase